MTIAAHQRGAAAVIIDGPITDLAALRMSPLPVFSRGASPLATQLLGEGGSINTPVVCAGLHVSPGDLVIADDDGVLVLPPEEAARILPAAQQEADGEVGYREQLMLGHKPSSLAPIGDLINGRTDALAAATSPSEAEREHARSSSADALRGQSAGQSRRGGPARP